MSFRSDAHLLLGNEPTPPEVTAWQHPNYPDSFTVALDTQDRHGHIAITGSGSQLLELLAQMTKAVTVTDTAAGQLHSEEESAQPGSRVA